MKLYLDTQAIWYAIEKNNVVTEKYSIALKKNPIMISIFSIFEIINQYNQNKLHDNTPAYYFKKLIDATNGCNFKILTSSIFDLNEKEIKFLTCSTKPNSVLIDKLYLPIINEYMRSLYNRLNIVWGIHFKRQSLLKCVSFNEEQERIAGNQLNSILKEKIKAALMNLYEHNNLNEKHIRSLYESAKQKIIENVVYSFAFYDNIGDIMNSLKAIDFDCFKSTVLPFNYFKVNKELIKQAHSGLEKCADESLDRMIIDSVYKRILSSNQPLNEFEEKIIKFEIKAILINEDVFKANDYIDLYIIRMFLDCYNKFINSTGDDDFYLITFDENMQKRMLQLNVPALEKSVFKSQIFKAKI